MTIVPVITAAMIILVIGFQTLFKRPKDVIALKFTEMISMLVSFR